MRILLLAAAIALSACGQNGATQSSNGCSRTTTHEVTWSADGAPDTITTSAQGPTCAQAVVTFVMRNAAGDPLWAFASTYYDMTFGGVPPEGAPELTDEQMDTFLAGWANVTEERTAAFLPEWRDGFDTLSASAQTFSYDTPFDRETYEMLRARDLKLICYAAAVEASQCLIMDPASHAPTMIVAYGP
ncbi:MAG: hypothetical protein R3C30_03870 [Hyphomonadaceae bacterium]